MADRALTPAELTRMFEATDSAQLARDEQAMRRAEQTDPVTALFDERDRLVEQARAKVPNLRITANPLATPASLRAEIAELREFIDRPPPGLNTDFFDEFADGQPDDGNL